MSSHMITIMPKNSNLFSQEELHMLSELKKWFNKFGRWDFSQKSVKFITPLRYFDIISALDDEIKNKNHNSDKLVQLYNWAKQDNVVIKSYSTNYAMVEYGPNSLNELVNMIEQKHLDESDIKNNKALLSMVYGYDKSEFIWDYLILGEHRYFVLYTEDKIIDNMHFYDIIQIDKNGGMSNRLTALDNGKIVKKNKNKSHIIFVKDKVVRFTVKGSNYVAAEIFNLDLEKQFEIDKPNCTCYLSSGTYNFYDPIIVVDDSSLFGDRSLFERYTLDNVKA